MAAETALHTPPLPEEGLLDTVRRYETPEGIELELRTVGPVPRALAWMIDSAIRLLLYIAAATLFLSFGGIGLGLTLILLFLVEWFYPVLFEVYRGRTPGKQLLGLQVIHDNGTPIGWSASLLRNLLRAVDFLPLFYSFGLLTMLANRDFKRLGDLAAGTLVVYRELPSTRLSPPPAEPIPPPPGLGVDDQQILLDFGERSTRLSQPRSEELANLLREVSGASGEAGVTRLLGYANWLAGGRQ